MEHMLNNSAPTLNCKEFREPVMAAAGRNPHSGASHSHTMYVISSAVKHCNSKLTSLLPARNTLHAIIQPHNPSSMVWLLLLLETAFVCLLINCEETVQFMQFVPECCLAIEYIQYKMVLLETVFVCLLIYCEASL